MIAVFWGNMYLSSIQQGIQAAHVVGNMIHEYSHDDTPEWKIIQEWSHKHKTMLLFNGGTQAQLKRTMDFLSLESDYPWAAMHESDDALNGSLTSVGVIVPQHVMDYSSTMKNQKNRSSQLSNNDHMMFGGDNGMNKFSHKLVEKISRSRHAI